RHRIEAMINWLEFDVVKLPKPDLQIILVAPDEHFSRGTHLHRSADHMRDYTEGAADIHETSVDLQLRVNAYYRNLKPSESVRLISIGEGDERLPPAVLADQIWGIMAELGLACMVSGIGNAGTR